MVLVDSSTARIPLPGPAILDAVVLSSSLYLSSDLHNGGCISEAKHDDEGTSGYGNRLFGIHSVSTIAESYLISLKDCSVDNTLHKTIFLDG